MDGGVSASKNKAPKNGREKSFSGFLKDGNRNNCRYLVTKRSLIHFILSA